MAYTKEIITGVSWLSGIRIITRGLSFFKTIIIGRILSPGQFGIFSIGTLLLSLIEILTETGINIFLVQQKDDVDRYINTSWIVSIVRGLIISCIIYFSVPFVTTFFNSPDSYTVLTLMSIIPFIRGFINPAVIKLQKELQFHIEFYYRSTLFLCETIVSIFLVIIFRTPEALIGGMIVSAIMECVWSFYIVRPRPKFMFEPKLFKQVIHHGKWITASTIFNYFYQHGDDIAVGRLLGTTSLGLYDMAYRLSIVPLSDITDVVMKVTFPVYVKMSDDVVKLRNAFLKTLGAIVIVVFPICLILFIFPEQILRIIGEKWVGAAGVLQILAIFGVIRAVSVYTTTLFLSVKKQEIATLVSFVGLVTLAITIVPLIDRFGMNGAGMSALLGTAATVPVLFYFVWKTLRLQ